MSAISVTRRHAYIFMVDEYLMGNVDLEEFVSTFLHMRREDINGEYASREEGWSRTPVRSTDWDDLHSDLFYACDEVLLYPELGYGPHDIDEAEFRVRLVAIRTRMSAFESEADGSSAG